MPRFNPFAIEHRTVPPQHPLAAKPCCLGCGCRDGRTKAGGLFCQDCIDEQTQNPPAPEIHRP